MLPRSFTILRTRDLLRIAPVDNFRLVELEIEIAREFLDVAAAASRAVPTDLASVTDALDYARTALEVARMRLSSVDPLGRGPLQIALAELEAQMLRYETKPSSRSEDRPPRQG
jgi:hypothetical protein